MAEHTWVLLPVVHCDAHRFQTDFLALNEEVGEVRFPHVVTKNPGVPKQDRASCGRKSWLDLSLSVTHCTINRLLHNLGLCRIALHSILKNMKVKPSCSPPSMKSNQSSNQGPLVHLDNARDRPSVPPLPLLLETDTWPRYKVCHLSSSPRDLEPRSSCTTVPFISSFRNGRKILKVKDSSTVRRKITNLAVFSPLMTERKSLMVRLCASR